MKTLRYVFPVRRSIVLVLLLLIAGGVLAQQRTKEFTLEDIFSSSTFSSRGVRGFQWIDGGKSYSYLETDSDSKQTDLWRCEVSSGKKVKVVDAASLVLNAGDKPFSIQNYSWAPDGRSILFTGTVPARSLKTGGNFYIYDLRNKSFRQLTSSDGEQINVKFSPDSKRVGFVRNHNIVVLNLEDGRETQLTFDGNGHVFNGHFDWVYEEEFSIIDGWQWSPDGKRIAFWQIDERRVPEFPIMEFLPLHQNITRQRYPKAGDPNAIVRIGVVPANDERYADAGSVSRPQIIWCDIGAPPDSTQDTYIPRIRWTGKENSLAIYRLNRQQNKLDLSIVDATTGKATIILTEEQKTWVEVEDAELTFFRNSDRFIWSSERDGFKHLYLYDLSGKMVKQLTQGRWDVERVHGVNENDGVVYFTAGVGSPLERELYSVKLDGSGLRRITKSNGWRSVNMSPDHAAFLESFSDVSTPTKVTLMRTDGSVIRTLADGAIDALKDYKISPKTFFTFKTGDGVELNGWMIKPHDFDAARKYPVLMTVYGGPGSQTVTNSWGGSGFLWYQLLAQKGYIVVSVDNRGTGARGKEFKSVTYKNLGKWETHDQIEGAKYLASLPYVDGSRIGITGGSYGGYMTLMCMLLGADVFKAGIAVSSVTHWKYYDTIYTERYMLTPDDNPDGYLESAPTTHAAKLKGKLLIIHGTDDDNVHLQNSMAMIDALIKEKKQFETMVYPGSKHGIRDRLHYYTKLTNFIIEKL